MHQLLHLLYALLPHILVAPAAAAAAAAAAVLIAALLTPHRPPAQRDHPSGQSPDRTFLPDTRPPLPQTPTTRPAAPPNPPVTLAHLPPSGLPTTHSHHRRTHPEQLDVALSKCDLRLWDGDEWVRARDLRNMRTYQLRSGPYANQLN